ncbi:MAG: glycosyltransferase family 4 protein [Methanotrichaceae archaeon]
MKVGVFIADIVPEAGGGYTFHLDLLQSLSKLAGDNPHDFVLFTNSKSEVVASSIIKLCDLHNISIFPIHKKTISILENLPFVWKIPFIGKILSLPYRLDRIAKREGVEIMWFIGPAVTDIDIPYITVVWDLQHRLQPWFPEVSINGAWQNREDYYLRVLKRASFIITGTEAGRKEIEYFYGIPTENIRVLPHPTPKYILDANPSDSGDVINKYSIRRNYLFYPAQFWSHKNHVNLLLSLKSLKENHGLRFSLVLVGSDMGNVNYVKEVTSNLGLSDQVFFLGFVPQNDLILLYRNAFALTYLSFFGPENLPPLEAFALGCPVVASKVSGAEEQLGDAALLVDPKSPEEIALAIKSLYDNPDLRSTLIKRGIERASSWTGDDFVRGIFSILDEFERIRRCWDQKLL